jgi:hypothetical protein
MAISPSNVLVRKKSSGGVEEDVGVRGEPAPAGKETTAAQVLGRLVQRRRAREKSQRKKKEQG